MSTRSSQEEDVWWLCDRYLDCSDGTDEDYGKNTSFCGHNPCQSLNKCIKISYSKSEVTYSTLSNAHVNH